MPYRLAVKDIAFFERPVRFARPFRFGAVVITATPQAFVRVEIEVEGKGRATSYCIVSAIIVTHWYIATKNPAPAPSTNSTSGIVTS